MRSSLVFQQTRPCPVGGEWKQKSVKLSCYVEGWAKNQNLSNELIDRWNSNKHCSWDYLQWQFAMFANKPYERQAAKSRHYWWKAIFQWEFVRICKNLILIKMFDSELLCSLHHRCDSAVSFETNLSFFRLIIWNGWHFKEMLWYLCTIAYKR